MLAVGIDAFYWGILSAISLPAGALLGLWWQPEAKINSTFMAFGGGALLFALTIELFGHVPHYVESHGLSALFATLGGAITGGMLYSTLNQVLNNRGAFLRRLSNARKYVARLKLLRTKQLLEDLNRVKILHRVPPETMAELIQSVRLVQFSEDETIFQQGDKADDMYFIVSGEVEIILHGDGDESESIATIGAGDTFGELGILSGAPRSAEARTLSKVRLYRILKNDFDELMRKTPALREEIKVLADSRVDTLSMHSADMHNQDWKNDTLAILEAMNIPVTLEEVSDEAEAVSVHAGGAALAIWMGILIDGVPESLVIGMLAVSASGMSLAFIAGVFLANMPEAMSSAVSMKNHGMSIRTIMLMWGSITLLTGVGAFIGATMFPANPVGGVYYLVLGIEALAAGAMLTMIAETMLPEAFEQGGSIVGLSTLAGFLVALAIKVI